MKPHTVNNMQLIGRTARRITDAAHEGVKKGHTFVIERIDQDCLYEANGMWHSMQNCELLPVSVVGRKARRKISKAGTNQPCFFQNHEFTIKNEKNGQYIEEFNFFHFSHDIDDCELLPEQPEIPTSDRPKREPIKPGTYGPVHVQDTIGQTVCIRINNAYLMVDELREAAHLFNQLAEQLDDAQVAHNNPDDEQAALTRVKPDGRVEVRATAESQWIDSSVRLEQPAYSPPNTDDTPIMGNVAALGKRYIKACGLLQTLYNKHWPELVMVKPHSTLSGVLDQIDDITDLLSRTNKVQQHIDKQQPYFWQQPASFETEIRQMVDKAVAIAMTNYKISINVGKSISKKHHFLASKESRFEECIYCGEKLEHDNHTGIPE